jgi:hypothetical protein
MVKMYQILELFGSDSAQELSILDSRKHNQAVVCSNSGGLQIASTPQRIGQCRKAGLFQRGLRKSSSLTNGMSPAETKLGSESMPKEARGLFFCQNLCQCAHPGHSGERFTKTERRRH